MTLDQQGHIVIRGARLEFRRWGSALSEAPTVVLLHEGLGCVAMWREFPAQLSAATGLGVFAYSRAGYGASSPCTLPRPLEYMEQEALSVLPDLLDAIGFKSGVLIGHSDGASIAAVHVGIYTVSPVRGIVLLAPHFFTEPAGLASIAAAREAYQTGDLRNRLARYHGENVDCAFRGWNEAWLAPGFKAWNIERFLNRGQVPVLAIQGREDEYGTARQIEVVAERCGARAETLLLDNCGHAPHRDQEAATLAAIASFIAKTCG